MKIKLRKTPDVINILKDMVSEDDKVSDAAFEAFNFCLEGMWEKVYKEFKDSE